MAAKPGFVRASHARRIVVNGQSDKPDVRHVFSCGADKLGRVHFCRLEVDEKQVRLVLANLLHGPNRAAGRSDAVQAGLASQQVDQCLRQFSMTAEDDNLLASDSSSLVLAVNLGLTL